MVSVVCFDIGIKNLAFCHLLSHPDQKYEIIGWENVNLLASDTPAESKKMCFGCKSKQLYEGGACTRHATKPPLTDLSGNKLMKIPSVVTLREILLQKEPTTKKSASKDVLLTSLRNHYSIPLQIVKEPKAQHVDLCHLHDCMRTLVLKHATKWSTVKEICLENQPAFKNPQMKSVQMMLFATIRDILQPAPPLIRLVHAGLKVQGKAKGDEGYKDRKKGSEDRVAAAIKTGKVLDPNGYYLKYQSAGKKNDLADAFSMALDSIVRQNKRS